MDIAHMVGGSWLLNAIAVVMAVACFGSGLTGQVGAARSALRHGARQRAAAGRVRPARRADNSPTLNIWLIGAAALAGAFVLNYERATELINFGAFLAFMGVNAAAIRVYWFNPPPGYRRQWLTDLVVPALGVLVLLLDLVEPAEAGPNRGRDLVRRGRAVCRDPDPRIPPPPRHARFQRRLSVFERHSFLDRESACPLEGRESLC